MDVRVELTSAVFEATRARLLARFGADVEEWWAQLPAALPELAGRWGLVVGEPVGRGNTSLVIRCRIDDGRAAMLKLTPDAGLASTEALALRSWEASGHVPRVWGCDGDLGALLLEAIPSETPVSEQRTKIGMSQVADLITALHQSGDPVVGGGVVPLADRVAFVFEHWSERYGRNSQVARVVPVERLERGHELSRELAADMGASVLLHGDMHPSNVLDGGPDRGLVAIDPRPCVGDPAVDAVDWVFWAADDRRGWESRGADLARRLGVDPERVWGWCMAFAAMHAASEVAGGGRRDRVEALLTLAP